MELNKLVQLIEQQAGVKFKKQGKEFHASCPFCKTQTKHLIVWPENDRYWCRLCGKKGDAIQFLRDYLGYSFSEACEQVGKDLPYHRDRLLPTETRPSFENDVPQTNYSLARCIQDLQIVQKPSIAWQRRGADFVSQCQKNLALNNEHGAIGWLTRRGLNKDTIVNAGLGLNLANVYDQRVWWDLPPEVIQNENPKPLWLPAGIVIPCSVDNELWAIRIRRLHGAPKYYFVPGGCSVALYNSGDIAAGRPAILVEGELDALTIQQEANDIISVAGTGSITGGRRPKWIARLSLASIVLIAYDNDDSGNKASEYWCEKLPNARVWRPYWDDPNQMLQDGGSVRNWVQSGLDYYGHLQKRTVTLRESSLSINAFRRTNAATNDLPLGEPLLREQADALNCMAKERNLQLQWQHYDLNSTAGWQEGRFPGR